MKVLFILILLAALAIDYMSWKYYSETNQCNLRPVSACPYERRVGK